MALLGEVKLPAALVEEAGAKFAALDLRPFAEFPEWLESRGDLPQDTGLDIEALWHKVGMHAARLLPLELPVSEHMRRAVELQHPFAT